MHFIVNRARFDRLPMVGARLHISRCFANYTLVCATDQKSNVSSKAPAGTLRPFKLACKLDRVFWRAQIVDTIAAKNIQSRTGCIAQSPSCNWIASRQGSDLSRFFSLRLVCVLLMRTSLYQFTYSLLSPAQAVPRLWKIVLKRRYGTCQSIVQKRWQKEICGRCAVYRLHKHECISYSTWLNH